LTKALLTQNDKASISSIVGTTQATTYTDLNIASLTQWVLDEPTNTSTDPYRIVKDGNKL